jgi:hypothetical protein
MIRVEAIRLPELARDATEWDRRLLTALYDQWRDTNQRLWALETTTEIPPRIPRTFDYQSGTCECIKQVTVTLGAADLAVLDTVPFELVATQGSLANALLIDPINFLFVLSLNGATMPVPGGTVGIYWTDSSNVQCSDCGDGLAGVFAGPDEMSIRVAPYISALGALQVPATYDATTQSVTPLVLQATAPFTIPDGGAIASATLAAGGAGYAVNDTGTINTGDGLATYLITQVAAGVVVTVTITSFGTAYQIAAGVTTTPGGAQPGVGAGFTLDITALDYSVVDIELAVTVLYNLKPSLPIHL